MKFGLTTLALSSLAAAQTYSECNPLRQSGCQPNPALGGSYDADFRKGESNKFTAVNAPSAISYSQTDGAHFTISKQGDNPTLQSKFHIMFGRVEAVINASPGQGVVSSLVMQSDVLDEIDLEWLGGSKDQVQSNWFSQGSTTTYTRGEFHECPNAVGEFHNYTIDWTKDSLTWYINGQQIRELKSTNGEGYPQTPMAIKVGSWAGGDPTNPQGTIDWAGGLTNYQAGPYTLGLGEIAVTDYSTGQSYSYSDQSGSWTSIRSQGGRINGNQ